MLYVTAADQMLDQRCALALNAARQHLMHLSLAAFKVLVRDQFFVLQLEPERAVEVLASLVPEADARKNLLKQVQRDRRRRRSLRPRPSTNRLARLSQVLAVPIEKPAAPAMSGRTFRHQDDRQTGRSGALKDGAGLPGAGAMSSSRRKGLHAA